MKSAPHHTTGFYERQKSDFAPIEVAQGLTQNQKSILLEQWELDPVVRNAYASKEEYSRWLDRRPANVRAN